MKTQFVFDKESGTMVPKDKVKDTMPSQPIEKAGGGVNPPKFVEEKKLTPEKPKLPMVVQMKKVDTPTPIQLIDENGVPIAYLDSVNSGVMMFRERQDYDICQITDDRTGAVLAYIGGYALQINFNMSELKTLEKIEQCLNGIVKLFRHKIMNQPLERN